MTLLRLQSCQVCKSSEPIKGETELECRRYPPTATAILVPVGPGRAAIQVHSSAPRVNPDFRCDEFKPRLIEASQITNTV